MKKFLFIVFLFTAVSVNSQTNVYLSLPDNCNAPNEIEDHPVVQKAVLTVFPNPNPGTFYVHAEFTTAIKKAKVIISDLKGNDLRIENVYCNSLELIKQIDIREIPAGTYFLKVISEKEEASVKLIIAK